MVSFVSYHSTKKEFTVEEAPVGGAERELSLEALRLRVRQQELLAEYGVSRELHFQNCSTTRLY
jgi:hypothetical protein